MMGTMGEWGGGGLQWNGAVGKGGGGGEKYAVFGRDSETPVTVTNAGPIASDPFVPHASVTYV